VSAVTYRRSLLRYRNAAFPFACLKLNSSFPPIFTLSFSSLREMFEGCRMSRRVTSGPPSEPSGCDASEGAECEC